MITAAIPSANPRKMPTARNGPSAPTRAPMPPPTSPPSTTPLRSIVPATIPRAVFLGGGGELIGVERGFECGHLGDGRRHLRRQSPHGGGFAGRSEPRTALGSAATAVYRIFRLCNNFVTPGTRGLTAPEVAAGAV